MTDCEFLTLFLSLIGTHTKVLEFVSRKRKPVSNCVSICSSSDGSIEAMQRTRGREFWPRFALSSGLAPRLAKPGERANHGQNQRGGLPNTTFENAFLSQREPKMQTDVMCHEVGLLKMICERCRVSALGLNGGRSAAALMEEFAAHAPACKGERRFFTDA